MKVHPLRDRVLVKRLESETKSMGGIIIPDSSKEKPLEGIVVSVGSGRRTEDGKLVAVDVPVGSRVMFGKYAGSEIEIDGESHIILKEEEILGILE